MNIRLKPEIAKLLETQVAAGRFASVDDAIAELARDDAVAETDLDGADLSWAKPYIDKGLSDVAAGRVVPAGDVHADLRSRFRVDGK